MNYALLLSGGTGERAGADIPKQYVSSGGRIMAGYALEALLSCERIHEVYVVCEEKWQESFLKEQEAIGNRPIRGFALPGRNRQCSILNGMEKIRGERSGMEGSDTILIHDAARPYLSETLLERLYEALPGHDGVMPALSMKDTVYQSIDGSSISGLLNRSELFAGQAPELFLFEPYYAANLRLLPDQILKINGASEPAVLAGMRVVMVPGEERNRKITSREDLERYMSNEGMGA